MKLFAGRRAVTVVLGLSLALNVGMIVSLAMTGGLRRIFMKMDLAELPKTRLQFQKETEERYRKYPNTAAEIDFVGDSLVGAGPWSELFGEIHNRGIGGETSSGLLGRIDEVTESKPRKIFLLLGTNDIAAGVPVVQFIRNYRTLLERIRKDSPATEINVIGIFPINSTFPIVPVHNNTTIAEANQQLAKLVAEFPDVRYLDLSPHVTDQAGNLRAEFTHDGVHMNTEAYLKLREPLAALVNEKDSRRVSDADIRP